MYSASNRCRFFKGMIQIGTKHILSALVKLKEIVSEFFLIAHALIVKGYKKIMVILTEIFKIREHGGSIFLHKLIGGLLVNMVVNCFHVFIIQQDMRIVNGRIGMLQW